MQRHNETIRQLLLEKYEPIAIVGIGLRFPGGSRTPDEFADFLRAGRSGIGPIPTDRWDVAGLATEDTEATGQIRMAAGGFLDRIDEFDASFFNISPKEATYVDPQQRMLLETAWEALENAAVDPTTLRQGNGGVYVGASSFDYALEIEGLPYQKLDGHLAAGITMFSMSGRLSYFLGWHGPSLTVDTACASALTALHTAVTGLRRKECDIALCGAVNALHHPRVPVIFTHANMLAPDGQCKTFDEGADGYARAEGCGVLVLKRFSDARRDGDTIHALVRGTAVGQDGDSAGLTVPNGTAQTAVMRAALTSAVLAPGDIQYVEAHGTGTPLGDPIELGAISDVFADSHSRADPVLVGSVKTNLGHMEPAAGIVGIVKTVLQMREGTIFPHLNLTAPSGRIPWDSYPVDVPTGCRPWAGQPRRAIVNSFGFAGTISAVVLEEPPAPPSKALPAQDGDGGHVFTLSAKNKRALLGQIERYQRYLAGGPRTSVADLCYTSNVGRAHFSHRIAGVVRDQDELAALLDKHRDRLASQSVRPGELRKVAFLFSGQGTQYPGMGAALYRQFAVFREQVDECDRLFTQYLGRSVRAMLLGEDDGLDQTVSAQPALFTVEYALAKLWLSWGVRPHVLIGHSIGEVVAASIAGIFTLPDSVALVAARAAAMQSVSALGGMAAVTAAVEEVAPLVAEHPDLAIAAVNSPRQCVVSGGRAALDKVVEALVARGLRVKPLAVSHAFHSPLMFEAYDAFRAALAGIEFHEPTMTVVSSVDGGVPGPVGMRTPDYWVRQIGEPVNFAAAVETVDRRGRHAFVEIGPDAALTPLARQCVPASRHAWLSSARRNDQDATAIRAAVAELYAAGPPVSWAGFHAGSPRRRITLPTYAFDRKRYWLPVDDNRHGLGHRPATGRADHPLLGTERPAADDVDAGVREFATRLDPHHPAYLADHAISGQVAVPASAYVEVLLALQDAVYGQTRRPIVDLEVHDTVTLPEEESVELRTRLRPRPDGSAEVEIVSGERRVVTATLGTGSPDSCAAVGGRPEGPADRFDGDDVYAELAATGVECGPEFRRLKRVDRYPGPLAVGLIRGRDPGAVEHLPPEVFEAALHAVRAVAADGAALRPVRFGRFRLFKKPKADDLEARVRIVAPGDGTVDCTADVMLLEGEDVVFDLRGLGLRRPADLARRHFFHTSSWVQRDAPAPARSTPLDVVTVHRAGPGLAGAIPAATVDDVGTLLRDRQVTDVCWFWRPLPGPVSAPALRAECELNYTDLLHLLAVLDRHGFGRDQRLWLVTERAQWLPGDRPGTGEQLAAATLWGFGHVLLNEYPNYRVTMVDLPSGEPVDSGLLADEWLAEETGEFQVAGRGGQRYVRRVLPSDPGTWPTTDGVLGGPGESREVRVRADRTYVITGGLGALGLVTAEKLVDLGARELALVSRRGLPADDATHIFQRLTRRAEVTVYQGDIGRASDMQRIAAALRRAPRPVGGIVHAAGHLDDRPVSAQTWASIDSLFQAKVYGAWLLHELAQSLGEVDFFVAYSSAASVVGGVTQANYAAANAFLDALMHWRSRQGLVGLSVNWGLWADVGMSARLSPHVVTALQAEGNQFFSPARALRAMVALLGQPEPQMAVGEVDWARFVPAKPVANALYAEVGAVADRAAGGVELAALLAQPPGERMAALEDLVRDRLAGVLRLDDVDAIDPQTEFVQLGLDSLMAVELKNVLEATFRTPLPASVAFDHPSAERLAEFLNQRLVLEETV